MKLPSERSTVASKLPNPRESLLASTFFTDFFCIHQTHYSGFHSWALLGKESSSHSFQEYFLRAYYVSNPALSTGVYR